jgi:hypothetical protein
MVRIANGRHCAQLEEEAEWRVANVVIGGLRDRFELGFVQLFRLLIGRVESKGAELFGEHHKIFVKENFRENV